MSAGTYYARRAMGKCINCGSPDVEPGHIMCLVCQMDRREYNRARWPARAEKANERHRTYQSERREKAREEGMCIMCCKRKAAPNHTSCYWCLARANERGKRARDGKRISDLGGCLRCGKPPVEGYRLCADCLPKAQAQMLYARSFRREENYFEKTKHLPFVPLTRDEIARYNKKHNIIP